jgi:hypothetical protein
MQLSNYPDRDSPLRKRTIFASLVSMVDVTGVGDYDQKQNRQDVFPQLVVMSRTSRGRFNR